MFLSIKITKFCRTRYHPTNYSDFISVIIIQIAHRNSTCRNLHPFLKYVLAETEMPVVEIVHGSRRMTSFQITWTTQRHCTNYKLSYLLIPSSATLWVQPTKSHQSTPAIKVHQNMPKQCNR